MKRIIASVLFFITFLSAYGLSKTELMEYAWVSSKEIDLDLSRIAIPDNVTIKAYIFYELTFYGEYCILTSTQVIIVDSNIADQQEETIKTEYEIVKDDVVIVGDVMFFAEGDILACYLDEDTTLIFTRRPKVSEYKKGGEV